MTTTNDYVVSGCVFVAMLLVLVLLHPCSARNSIDPFWGPTKQYANAFKKAWTAK
jgi:hypothetical protein